MTTIMYVPVGDTIPDQDEMEAMPPGTVITTSSTEYTRRDDGYWYRASDNRAYRTNQFTRTRQVRVVSYPVGTRIEQRPPESLEHYKWRFRQYALACANQHGVSYHASRDVLDALGTGPRDLPMGKGLLSTDTQTWQNLPEGSMVFAGKPEMPGSFTVFEKSGSRWLAVLGSGSLPNGPVTIYRVGAENPAEPPWLVSTDLDAAAEADKIAAFKADVWRQGWQLKRTQSWCSTYEAVLREFGITRASMNHTSMNGIRVGDRVSPDQAAALPYGSVFKWQSSTDGNTFGLYVRARNADNIAGTLKVGGTEQCSERNYHSSMQVLSIAATDNTTWCIAGSTVEVRAYVDALKPGVRLATGDEEQANYGKALDGKIINRYQGDPIPETGRWAAADFGENPNFIIHAYEGVTL